MRVGYFDLEAANWDSFLVGGYLPEGESTPTLVWHSPEDFLDALASHPGTEWRAHYSGRYDSLLLLTLAARRGWTLGVTTRGASVLKARLTPPGEKKARITLTDTFALAPVGLAKLAKAAGQTQKGEIDFEDERFVAGLSPSSPLGRQLAEYLTADVLALRDGDVAWRQVLRDVAGVEPALTLGATAWKSAQARLVEHDLSEDVKVALQKHEYNDGRAAYFGGRVEVLRTETPLVWRYDRNSSYPAALTRQPVPVGRRRWRTTWDGEEGTVWARVTVPECRHPPLPIRLGSGRLVFPTGTFEGAWTTHELRRAVDVGVRIEQVLRARIAEETTDALAGWCWHVWRARQSMQPWQGLLKLLANSLTGKLAQRDERTNTFYGPVERMPKDAEQLTTVRDGRLWWRTESHVIGPCARPEWAAYLAAEARVELHRQLLEAGDQSAYCDTDSVYSRERLTRGLGTELGEWKLEGTGADWRAAAPKLYRYETDGHAHVRGRGLRGLTPEGYERLTEPPKPGADRYKWESSAGVRTLLGSLKRHGEARFERASLRRGLAPPTQWVGSRLRRTGGDTRPPTYAEALALWD